jgi:hypothetical protein
MRFAKDTNYIDFKTTIIKINGKKFTNKSNMDIFLLLWNSKIEMNQFLIVWNSKTTTKIEIVLPVKKCVYLS